MTKLELTAEELKLVQLYAGLPMGGSNRACRFGSSKMNANRMFRQFRYADHLQSICSKTWG
jgi:hypothetical protein